MIASWFNIVIVVPDHYNIDKAHFMKQISVFLSFLFIYQAASAQVAVNTNGSAAHPSAILDVASTTKGLLIPRMTNANKVAIASPTSGLIVYQTDVITNSPRGMYVYDAGWKEMAKAEDLNGGGSWTLGASGLYTNHGGFVGIGTSTPDYKLQVVGNIHATTNVYVGNSLGIGTTTPGYKIQVNNGDLGFYNTTDAKTWSLGYNSSSNIFSFTEGSTTRIVIANGGNVGIGNASPTTKLHVTGSGRFTDNLAVDDNLTVDNNVTVDGGKGIIRNSGAPQLRYLTFQAPFAANLPAHGSLTANIVWNAFNSPPVVYAANIVISGGASGELYRCILQIYNVTASGCDCKIINTDDLPINQNITWNIVCIGN